MAEKVVPKVGERWIDKSGTRVAKIHHAGRRYVVYTANDWSQRTIIMRLFLFLRVFTRDDSLRWPRTTKGKPPAPIRTKFSVPELLTALGSTADEVAETLRASGIKGNHWCNMCPIAVYLQRFDPLVRVNSFEWWRDGAIWERYELPRAVHTFVDRFDDGRYTDLYREAV